MMAGIKDPVSCLTHMAGIALSVLCTVLLLAGAGSAGSARSIVAFAVFGASLILLYTASTVYHMLHVSDAVSATLRRIDHMMIFVLIAGTYTPVCLLALRGAWGWSLLALVWGFALAGILLKALWMGAPRWLSTGIYVLMGWLVLVAFVPLRDALSGPAFGLLAAGGLSYTLGALIYAVKWPPFRSRWFGYHELFHLFVMGGSVFHGLFMFRLFPV